MIRTAPAILTLAVADAMTLPDPHNFASVGWVVVIVGVLAATAYYATGTWSNLKMGRRIDQPQQRDFRLVEDFTKKTTCKEIRDQHERNGHVEEFRAVRREIAAAVAAANEAGEARATAIHQRINDVPDRIIATLRNTGAIK